MKRLVRNGVIAVLALGGASYGLWSFIAYQAERSVFEFVENSKQAGWAIQFTEEMTSSGFPTRIDVTMGDITATRRHALGELTAITLTPRIELVPWHLSHVTVPFEDIDYRIADGDGATILHGVVAGGELTLDRSAGFRGDLALSDFDLKTALVGQSKLSDTGTIEAAVITLTTQSGHPVDGAQDVLDISTAALSLTNFEIKRPDLVPIFGDRRGDLELALSGNGLLWLDQQSHLFRLREDPPNQAEIADVLKRWRNLGGQLEIQHLRASLTPTVVTGTWKAAFAEDGEVAGTGLVEVEGAQKFLSEPVAQTLLGRQAVLTSQLVVAGLTRPLSDGRHGVSFDLKIENGIAEFGPLLRQPVMGLDDIAAQMARQAARDWVGLRRVPVAPAQQGAPSLTE